MKVSLALALLLSAYSASAATVSYTVSPGTTILSQFSYYNDAFVYPDVALPLFNPALGTLTNVTITARTILAGSIPNGYGGITNWGYGTTQFAGVSFGNSTGGCGSGVSGSSSFPDNVGIYCNEYYSKALTGEADAAPFYGTTTATLTWPDMYAEATKQFGQTMTVALVAGSYRTVTYEYESATPEPSTASLLLGAGAVLGLVVRRRQR